ncbi:MAG: MoaD/ThiS family protein [Bacillota bacterium]
MIVVSVRAIMWMAEVLGGREHTVVLSEGSSVADLLDALERRYGPGFAEAVYDPGTRETGSKAQVLVNGRNIAFLEGRRTRLADGDDVFFLSPVSGG